MVRIRLGKPTKPARRYALDVLWYAIVYNLFQVAWHLLGYGEPLEKLPTWILPSLVYGIFMTMMDILWPLKLPHKKRKSARALRQQADRDEANLP